MSRFSSAVIGGVGVTVGLLIGAGIKTVADTDSRQRRRIMRDSRRAMRKAGRYFHEMFD
jgi:hypothetical protein